MIFHIGMCSSLANTDDIFLSYQLPCRILVTNSYKTLPPSTTQMKTSQKSHSSLTEKLKLSYGLHPW